jgi:hypothetical protein
MCSGFESSMRFAALGKYQDEILTAMFNSWPRRLRITRPREWESGPGRCLSWPRVSWPKQRKKSVQIAIIGSMKIAPHECLSGILCFQF